MQSDLSLRRVNSVCNRHIGIEALISGVKHSHIVAVFSSRVHLINPISSHLHQMLRCDHSLKINIFDEFSVGESRRHDFFIHDHFILSERDLHILEGALVRLIA